MTSYLFVISYRRFPCHGIVQIPLNAHFNTTKMTTLAATMIFEDNTSCIVLANSEGHKPQTKHIAIKQHFFHDQIKQGHIKRVKVNSNFNWVNILTKPLTHQKQETLQKMMMGW
jgi:hypothetical protein